MTGTTQDIVITTQPDGAVCVLERDGDVIATIESTPATVEIECARTPIRLGCS
ncbi:MAG: hypothetical protein GDA49_12000 [Rhodospirillales bacterium]|nr:hypothetical protein [Rhodospirillales bacterium]